MAHLDKEPWDESRIFSAVEGDSGKHFDPEIVEIFFSRIDMIRSIQNRYSGD